MAKGRRQQTKQRRHVPLRTCVVCREKRPKRRLTRIARTADSGVIVDPSGRASGRGAYLCDRPACWDKAVATGILDRALKTTVTEAEKAALASHRPAESSM